MPPPLVHYSSEVEYRRHYETRYCRTVIHSFDGIRVYFPKRQFDHAFFGSADRKARDKSLFSRPRAQRIDWIRAALEDPAAELFVGWDRDKKRLNPRRRVTVIYGNYVIVLSLKRLGTAATFITAYLATPHTLRKIRSGPRWPRGLVNP